MYSQIQWTSYRFSTPEALSEELYAAAKSSPAEFRRELIAGHLRRSAKRLGRMLLATWGVAAALIGILIGIASMLETSKRDSWSYHLLEVLGAVASLSVLSGVLSAASFIKYAVDYRMYWLAVCNAAGNATSYPEFLAAANGLKQRARRTGRPLCFKKVAAVIAIMVGAGVFLVALNGQTGTVQSTSQQYLFPAFCGFLIGLPTFLVATFYSNKYS